MNATPECERPAAGRVRALFVAPVVAALVAFPILAAPAGDPAPAALATCVACHGTRGEGATAGIPRLAGQNVDYLANALAMFKAGKRASVVMQPIAQTLDDAEIRALADHFSKQIVPPVDAAAAMSAELALAGQRLAETGAAGMPACFGCHAAGGAGNGARFPSIAGQPARFIVDRLHEFQARARVKAPEAGSMTAVAATMDERQIEQAAAYLSKLAR